jgi:F-type H+-transporting ATPase subunit delta
MSGIAGRYASAVYELADEQKQLDAVAEDLRHIRAMLDESVDLQRLVRSPLLGRDEQGRAVEAVLAKAEIGVLTRHFIAIVARNRRLFALHSIIAAYLETLATRRGEVTAEITSAAPLAEPQTKALGTQLAKLTGKQVTLDFKIDPSLLGGLVVRMGSRMYDSSLKSKLQKLQFAMKGTG